MILVKKIIKYYLIVALLISCGGTKNVIIQNTKPILTTIDLVNVKDDKVMVEIIASDISTENIHYFLPKIIPGTYSNDNYGNYIDDLKAFDIIGNPLSVTKDGDNSWNISNATQLHKITYWVNDTYDSEDTNDVFSPSGSNILKNKNFVLNLHAFIGYFEGQKQFKYELAVKHPKTLKATTSMVHTKSEKYAAITDYDVDVFYSNRYPDLVDTPIMYSNPDQVIFTVNDIEVVLSVYSPNKVHTAARLKPEMERMMRAQKNFLGDINSTKRYAIILYLSTMQDDAGGFGALEHNASTVVVMPESIPLDALNKAMIDVVSHEFFHILTPLTIHSEQIHYFDFNTPKMSKHLWMYEGTTEYFANLFQITQGLISKEDFFERLLQKISTSKQQFDDSMSFTQMSENILTEPYKKNYVNVYEKGALISMCIDLIIREKSGGASGILDLMKSLSYQYGISTPFEDDKLIEVVTELTYPEVGEFLKTHVEGKTPIDYEIYFKKAGVEFGATEIQTMYFIQGQQPYISGNESTNEVFFVPGITYNSFLNAIGIQGGDILMSINDKKYTLANVYDLLSDPNNWTDGDDITFVVKRNDEIVTLKGKVSPPTLQKKILVEKKDITPEQTSVLKAWLND